METYLSLKKCINGDTVGTAKELGLSTITVNKWQEPHTDFTDSGSYNPLDRINTIIHRSVRKKNPPDRAYAPLYCLALEHGFVCITLPRANDHDMVNIELVKSIKEFADLAGETSEALKDGRISLDDARKIEIEGNEALRAITTLLHVVKEVIR